MSPNEKIPNPQDLLGFNKIEDTKTQIEEQEQVFGPGNKPTEEIKEDKDELKKQIALLKESMGL